MEDKLLRDLLLGFVRVHILYHAAQEPIYGKEFLQELQRHGYDLSYGTLYPIFHKLEERGYLQSTEQNVQGKIRRYYFITEDGQEILARAKLQAKELVDELFEDRRG